MQRTSNRGIRGQLLGLSPLGLIRVPIKGSIKDLIRDLDTSGEVVLLFLAHEF